MMTYWRRLNKKQRRIISRIIPTAVGVVLFLALAFLMFVPVDGATPEVIVVRIQPGLGLTAIADLLKDNHVIRSRYMFILYALAAGQERNLQAGRYVVSSAMSISELVRILVEGKAEPDDITVLIPEGYNIWQIDRRLTLAGFIREGQFAAKFHDREGYFFPDSYRFSAKLKLADNKSSADPAVPDAIAEVLSDNFNAKIGDVDKEIVIIASLLEKEARTENDMRIVAGIIYKRIERGMFLQLDASVAYGWCLKQSEKNFYAKFCDVTQAPIASEIKLDGPYNTYARAGLPAGPIANPGQKALDAAMHPLATDYLYYLSPREGGSLIFSKTAAEHTANRRKYLGI